MVRAGNGTLKQRYFLVSPPNLPPPALAPPALVEGIVPPITPFNLSSFERLPGGAFRLAFDGKPGANTSSRLPANLVAWTVLGPARNSYGKVDFIDPDAQQFTLRFYRVALVWNDQPSTNAVNQTNTAGGAVGPSFPVGTLSLEEVEKVKQKLHLLTGDMTVKQALVSLGLSPDLPGAGASSGQTANSVFFLRDGHILRLYSRFTAQSGTAENQPSRVFEAELDGETWQAK